MPESEIDMERTGRAQAKVDNTAPTGRFGRDATGRVTATLRVYEPGERA